jgi:head-tail adaptor
MIANRLTEQITINRRTSVSDGAGGYTPGDTNPVVSTLANVKHKSVSNDLIAQYGELIEVYEFTIRYRQDIEIKSTDSIDWRGRTFEIIGLPPGFIGRKQIKIIAKTSNKSTDDGGI